MPAQAHGSPGISPAGRSPVVLHPNASHGLPPPYCAVPVRRHGLGPSDLPEAGSRRSGASAAGNDMHRQPGRPAHGPAMISRLIVEVYVPTMMFDGRLSHHPTGAPAEDAPMFI